MSSAEIGVFGGSGFYAFLDEPEEVSVETPYGAPSAPITIGTIGERRSRSCRGTARTTSSRRTSCRTARTSGR